MSASAELESLLSKVARCNREALFGSCAVSARNRARLDGGKPAAPAGALETTVGAIYNLH